MERVPAGSEVYVLLSRGIIVAFAVASVVLVRVAWRRNGYDDRRGLVATVRQDAVEEGL
jgi:hypothetical protein